LNYEGIKKGSFMMLFSHVPDNLSPEGLSGFHVCDTIRLKQGTFFFLVVLLAGIAIFPFSQFATAQAVPAPSGIVSWWPAEGNTRDIISGNTGIVKGGLGYAPGKVGSAFLFGGTNIFLTMPAITNSDLRSFTIEFWLWFDQLGVSMPLVEFSQVTGWEGVAIWVNVEDWNPVPTPGMLYANLNESNKYATPYPLMHVIKTGLYTLETNQWQHIALSYDNGTGVAQLFANGTSVKNTNMGSFVPMTSMPINVGYRSPYNGDDYQGQMFRGMIDELSIYKRALSPGEINAIYRAGASGKISPSTTAIVVQPAGGTFTNSVVVTLINKVGIGDIHYTLNNSEPTEDSPIYVGALRLEKTAHLQARVFFDHFPVSDISSNLFTIVSDPVVRIFPPGGLFTNSVLVSMNKKLQVGSIRYTLDGSAPTSGSAAYTSPIEIDRATVIHAQLFIDGYPASEVVAASFQRVYALDDGISSEWRERYFGSGYLTDPRVAVDADPDGDGAMNLQEFIAGTDPLNPLSGFAVNIQTVPLIRWHSESNQLYRVLRRPKIESTNWQNLAEVRATNQISSFIDASSAGQNFFYVIEPVKEPQN
jgi:hypothetical protein